MGRWVRVAATADVRPGRARTVLLGSERVALFNVGGVFFAIDDTCPHRGASLGEGLLVEDRVICPWHSWVFDVRTGRNVHAPEVGVRVYPVRCSGDDVEIEAPEEGRE